MINFRLIHELDPVQNLPGSYVAFDSDELFDQNHVTFFVHKDDPDHIIARVSFDNFTVIANASGQTETPVAFFDLSEFYVPPELTNSILDYIRKELANSDDLPESDAEDIFLRLHANFSWIERMQLGHTG